MRLLCLAALFAAACGSASGAGECSSPGTVECVNDRVSRVCASDKTWVAQSCASNEVCMGGSSGSGSGAGGGGCIAKADVSCNSTDSGCTDSTHALVCNADGMGFKSVACPPNTTCSGFGNCIGTCVVGSSRCNGTNVVQTCTDGFTYTDSDCMPGTTSCVTTTSANAAVQLAACKPMACQPSGTQCGNKAADPNDTSVDYSSTCVASPAGMHWQSEQCAIPGSCVTGSGCVQTCVPGSQRCNGLGIQVCNAQAQWGAITACQPTSTGAEQTCQTYSGYPICGDPVCAYYPGACEADGYHPCVMGKVSATAQACAQGVCVGGNVYNGITGGSCQPQCNPGDTRCDGNEAFEGCDANHRWSNTVTQCAANGTDHCIGYTDPTTGGSKTVCGACAPGSHRCTDSAGSPTGSPLTDIQTCDATGHFPAGSYAPCSVGQCQSTGSDAACVAQCVPNSTLCLGGAPATAPNPTHPGQVNWGLCDANGNIPTSGGTACGAGTSCRKSANGQPVGTGANACVVCVGPNIAGGNEAGFTDTACVTTASPNSVETCNASNMWNTPTVCSNTSPYTGVCKPEGGLPFCNGSYCTNSYLTTIGYGGCAGYWGTGYQPWGSTPDCCSYAGACLLTSGSVGPAACQ